MVMHSRNYRYALGALCLSVLFAPLSAHAGTVAYWRFEEGPADAQMKHLSGANGVWSADVVDSSGNGNHLSVWTGDAWGGYKYRASTPLPTIPQTGDANNFSIQNSGNWPGMWNNTLQAWSPSAFTIEATFKAENGQWRTLVGRDSKGAGTMGGADGNAAALYFQIQPDNRVAITFQDVSGYQHTAVSEKNAVISFDFASDPTGSTGKWYSMAGISDGKGLYLYLNDIASGLGYQQVAYTDLTLSGSLNTALTAGVGSGSDWSAGNFSVGRGLYNGGHGDRAFGFIDEVRLSEGAVGMNNLLYSQAVPEPATLAIVGTGLVSLMIRRRKNSR